VWKHSGPNNAVLDSLGRAQTRPRMKVELQRPVKRAPSVLAEIFFLRAAGGYS